MSIQVSQLFYYPVKSLKGIGCSGFALDEFGPKWDRRFMLIDEKGRFFTQRQCPKMGQIHVSVDDQTITLSMAGEETTSSLQLDRFDQIEVQVWSDRVKAREMPSDVNKWLSDRLSRDVRLCFIEQDTIRQVDIDYSILGDRVSFADGFPLLILSEATIEFLSGKLDFVLDAIRFRPNIVVSGCGAFEENTWTRIKINNINIDIVKPCSRCVIPTINPVDGEKQQDVMKVMLEYCKIGNQVYVGQNAIHRSLGDIRVGHQVHIIKAR